MVGQIERTIQHRVYRLKRPINLLPHLRPRQDNLAAHKDQEHNLRLHHPINQAWEQLWLVAAEVVMFGRKAFETDRELDVAGADDVLDFEIRELGIEAELLDDTSVFAASKLTIIFGFSASNDHFPRGEYQGGSLGLANTHDHGGETL